MDLRTQKQLADLKAMRVRRYYPTKEVKKK